MLTGSQEIGIKRTRLINRIMGIWNLNYKYCFQFNFATMYFQAKIKATLKSDSESEIYKKA